MKYALLSLLLLAGCKQAEPPIQAKRITVMSDTDNYIFTVREPVVGLSMLRTCDYAPLWAGLTADIGVQWFSRQDWDNGPSNCYKVLYVRPVGAKP
jgi:hypothetical protein